MLEFIMQLRSKVAIQSSRFGTTYNYIMANAAIDLLAALAQGGNPTREISNLENLFSLAKAYDGDLELLDVTLRKGEIP
jgi:hypothetical protein